LFGSKKKKDEASIAGLPADPVTQVSVTPVSVGPSSDSTPPALESTAAPREGTVPTVAEPTTMTFGGGATVIDARNVPGLRDELLDVISHGGNPAEIQDIVMKAMTEGQAKILGET